ncbi:hypothetical protein AVEN_270635-1, partial [Araneus ventricosus]
MIQRCIHTALQKGDLESSEETHLASRPDGECSWGLRLYQRGVSVDPLRNNFKSFIHQCELGS